MEPMISQLFQTSRLQSKSCSNIRRSDAVSMRQPLLSTSVSFFAFFSRANEV